MERINRGRPPIHGGAVGGRASPLYRVWSGIKARCNNPSSSAYPRYGGRGIVMCKEWSNSYAAFSTWAITNGYSVGLQIDRIDNNGGYFPSNCRWVTGKVNCSNRRNSIAIGFSSIDAAAKVGVTPQAIRHRIKKLGMTPEQASAMPKLIGGQIKHSAGILGKWKD